MLELKLYSSFVHFILYKYSFIYIEIKPVHICVHPCEYLTPTVKKDIMHVNTVISFGAVAIQVIFAHLEPFRWSEVMVERTISALWKMTTVKNHQTITIKRSVKARTATLSLMYFLWRLSPEIKSPKILCIRKCWVEFLHTLSKEYSNRDGNQMKIFFKAERFILCHTASRPQTWIKISKWTGALLTFWHLPSM